MTLKDEKVAILNPNGTIEVIEFFDYNCGHCKRESKVIKEFLKNRKDVRIVLKPIPILGQASMYATQIGHGIMLSEPDKYLKYFDSIMDDTVANTDSIHEALKVSGVDIEKLKEILDKNKDQIGEIIRSDLELADNLGVQGTPAFVINGELISGAVGIDILNKKTI